MSDRPASARYDPAIARPETARTGPPRPADDGCSAFAVAVAVAPADVAGVAEAEADGDALGGADGRVTEGAATGVGAAGAGVAEREHAAGRAASAARVSSPRRASLGWSFIHASSVGVRGRRYMALSCGNTHAKAH